MADNKDDKDYKGPSKTDSAIGNAVTSGAINTVGTGVVGAGIGALFKNTAEVTTKFSEKAWTGRWAGAYKGGKWGGIIGGAAGAAYGAYNGLKEHEANQDQLKQLGADLEKTRDELTKQKTFVDMLTKEKIEADKPKER